MVSEDRVLQQRTMDTEQEVISFINEQSGTTFKLAEAYKENGMAAYSELQQKEFGAEKDGYSATKHQREVGVSYFDAVSNAVTKGQSATTAMDDSTETDQF